MPQSVNPTVCVLEPRKVNRTIGVHPQLARCPERIFTAREPADILSGLTLFLPKYVSQACGRTAASGPRLFAAGSFD